MKNMDTVVGFLDDVASVYCNLTKHGKYNWQWLGLRLVQVVLFPMMLLPFTGVYLIAIGIQWLIDSTPRGKS